MENIATTAITALFWLVVLTNAAWAIVLGVAFSLIIDTQARDKEKGR